jgi:hypothetical protein
MVWDIFAWLDWPELKADYSRFSANLSMYGRLPRITVLAQSKARNVFAHLNTRIVGSNPTQGMDVCVRFFCVCDVLCVGSGLMTG